ncbi:MAG TPA: hypothetical protein VID67_10620 [Rhizomicrobium sp.]
MSMLDGGHPVDPVIAIIAISSWQECGFALRYAMKCVVVMLSSPACAPEKTATAPVTNTIAAKVKRFDTHIRN